MGLASQTQIVTPGLRINTGAANTTTTSPPSAPSNLAQVTPNNNNANNSNSISISTSTTTPPKDKNNFGSLTLSQSASASASMTSLVSNISTTTSTPASPLEIHLDSPRRRTFGPPLSQNNQHQQQQSNPSSPTVSVNSSSRYPINTLPSDTTIAKTTTARDDFDIYTNDRSTNNNNNNYNCYNNTFSLPKRSASATNLDRTPSCSSSSSTATASENTISSPIAHMSLGVHNYNYNHHHSCNQHQHQHNHTNNLSSQGPVSRLLKILHPYTPFLIWAGVSILVALIVVTNHKRIFSALDALSLWLREQGFLGYFVLYTAIFITTVPPMPMYSTLIILSGYALGSWKGFFISYAAALSGAIVVFILSRYYLRSWMIGFLSKSKNLLKVVSAIEKRPRLLFLIRLSPYPYNVINVLLASSKSLTLRTYVSCTALSLLKLIVHTSIGSTIRNFAEYHSSKQQEQQEQQDLSNDPDFDLSGGNHPNDYLSDQDKLAIDNEESGRRIKTIAGAIGAALCVAVFIYLLIVARRAVDEEVGDDYQQEQVYHERPQIHVVESPQRNSSNTISSTTTTNTVTTANRNSNNQDEDDVNQPLIRNHLDDYDDDDGNDIDAKERWDLARRRSQMGIEEQELAVLTLPSKEKPFE